MKYRAEIDGLRAVAVIIVMMFHAGFKYFRGGFIGVDIFLVISGYLITTIILSEMDRGIFSLVNFYERRARRILPPLFLVMIVSLLFAWFWLLPSDMKDFSQSLMAVSSFSSNILFWQTSGYWDTASELKPLLHTWSLAVEEQYYIIFPLFLILMWRYGKRPILSSLMLIATISLAAAQWGSYKNSVATFYLLPARVWELALGAGIAFYFLYKKNDLLKIHSYKLLNELLALLGLLLISYSILSFDENTPFPSLYALAPTIGTGLIIFFSSSKTMIGRILGAKPFAAIGLISYSAYLWHQPLFAFTRYQGLIELNELTYTALIFLSLFLAYLSWRFVEKPFRNHNIFGRKVVFTFALMGSIGFIVFGFIGDQSDGFKYRLTENQKALMSFDNYKIKEIYREGTCFLEPEQKLEDFTSNCFLTNIDGDSIFIWGDSHAAALSYGFRENYPIVMQMTASGCLPLIGYRPDIRPHCNEINNYVLDKIGELKPKILIMHSNWIHPVDKIRPGLYKALTHTITLVKSRSPKTEIIILGGVPQWEPSLPILLLQSHVELNEEAFIYSRPYANIKNTDNILNDVADKNGSSFISLLNIFCTGNKCLSSTKQADIYEPFAWDYGHLTKSSSIIVSKKIFELIMPTK